MEELLIALLELFGELLLQIFAQTLFDVGLRGLAAPFREDAHPYLASIGYLVLGAIVGAVSLLVVPRLMIVSPTGRAFGVVVLPVLAGATMALLGAWRRRRGQRVVLIDRFAYGYLFALAMTLVRLRFGS